MSTLMKVSLAVGLFIFVVIGTSLYVISEVERGVTLRFGEMI